MWSGDAMILEGLIEGGYHKASPRPPHCQRRYRCWRNPRFCHSGAAVQSVTSVLKRIQPLWSVVLSSTPLGQRGRFCEVER